MYELEIIAADNSWTLYRINDGSGAAIDNMATQAVASGDSIGMAIKGTGANVTIEAWFKASAGSWALHDTFVDSDAARITSSGNIGMETSDGSDWIIDEFGGGEIVTATSTATVAWITA
jgi:hypothetical protein